MAVKRIPAERRKLLEEWHNDPHRKIPVNMGSGRYKIRFEDGSEGIFTQEQVNEFYEFNKKSRDIIKDFELDVIKDGKPRKIRLLNTGKEQYSLYAEYPDGQLQLEKKQPKDGIFPGIKYWGEKNGYYEKERLPLTSITVETIKKILKGEVKSDKSALDSANDRFLQAAKNAALKEIKRQYDYSGSVEFADNILHSNEIPKGATPEHIKQMMIYNAQQVVDTIEYRRKEQRGERELELPFEEKVNDEINENREAEHFLEDRAKRFAVDESKIIERIRQIDDSSDINSPDFKMKSFLEYRKNIKVETMQDFAFHMRFLAEKFPDLANEAYGGIDSLKCAKFIIGNAVQIDREAIDFGLEMHGGTTPEKIKEILDRWAGIERHLSKGKEREKSIDDQGMGW